jgi:hypothetical protein
MTVLALNFTQNAHCKPFPIVFTEKAHLPMKYNTAPDTYNIGCGRLFFNKESAF